MSVYTVFIQCLWFHFWSKYKVSEGKDLDRQELTFKNILCSELKGSHQSQRANSILLSAKSISF